MTLKVLFLGVLKFTNKQTGNLSLRLTYLVNDDKSKIETTNFKGLNECVYYIDDVSVYDKFVKEDALTPMEFIVEQRPSQNNPLKAIMQVTEIRTKRDTIKLL